MKIRSLVLDAATAVIERMRAKIDHVTDLSAGQYNLLFQFGIPGSGKVRVYASHYGLECTLNAYRDAVDASWVADEAGGTKFAYLVYFLGEPTSTSSCGISWKYGTSSSWSSWTGTQRLGVTPWGPGFNKGGIAIEGYELLRHEPAAPQGLVCLHNLVQAYGCVRLGTVSPAFEPAAFNVDAVSYDSDQIDVSFGTSMRYADYVVVGSAFCGGTPKKSLVFEVYNQTAAGFSIALRDAATNLLIDPTHVDSEDVLASFMVCGLLSI
jgi:hypothetical protein